MIVWVVGTGTNVGKTTFCAAWLRRLRPSELRAKGWKAIETGGNGDSLALADACGEAIAPAWSFVPPISPHVAARQVGVRIVREELSARALALSTSVELLLVETAGGLFSPLNDDGDTNAELVGSVPGAKIVLVARNRLGVLHDVEACRRAFLGRFCVVVLSGPTVDDSGATNARELARQLPVVELPTPELSESADGLLRRLCFT